MIDRKLIYSFIDSKKKSFIEISNDIWDYAEIGLKEYKSASRLISVLEQEGFSIQKKLAGIDTAFSASYGNGSPVIAFLGEFDALPNLSQKKATPVRKKLTGNTNGHGCGHNLLGTGSLAAAAAVKFYLQKKGVPGTIIFFGCPGEENGSGKTYMTRAGCFDGVNAALTWHPSDITCVMDMKTLANLSVYFRFKGKTSHAASSPHLGRSSLDAVELMNIGVNFLREHIIPDARVHYAITDSGGSAPNVIPDYAEVYYFIRAPRVYQAQEIYERVCDIARGAAMMTGTVCEIQFAQGLSDYIPNRTLGEVLQKNLINAEAPDFSNDDRKLALKFRETFSESEKQAIIHQVEMFQGAATSDKLKEKPLMEFIGPSLCTDKVFPGSTDVGDVSYVVPTAQITMACCALGTVGHTWQYTAQTASSIGHAGMIKAAKVLALSALGIFEDPDLLQKADKELKYITKGEYICPIPESIQPEQMEKILKE